MRVAGGRVGLFNQMIGDGLMSIVGATLFERTGNHFDPACRARPALPKHWSQWIDQFSVEPGCQTTNATTFAVGDWYRLGRGQLRVYTGTHAPPRKPITCVG